MWRRYSGCCRRIGRSSRRGEVAPNDFTLAITYTGGGLDGTGVAPLGVAIDASGDVWVPNFSATNLSEFNSNGVPKTGSPFQAAGLDNPTSVAIDTYGSAWVANYNGNDISEFNSQGQKISGPPGFTGGGLNEPYGIAIDNVGNAWAANFGGNSVSEFESNASGGLALSGSSGFGDQVLAEPAGIAADSNGNVWVANYGAAHASLAEAVPSALPGQPAVVTLYTGAGLNSPFAVAIDGQGHVWATNRGGSGSVSELSSTGGAVSGTSGWTGGGLNFPYGIAIDGAGDVWAANNGGDADSISEISSAGAADQRRKRIRKPWDVRAVRHRGRWIRQRVGGKRRQRRPVDGVCGRGRAGGDATVSGRDLRNAGD